MPFTFDFDPANRILRGRLEGRVTDEDLHDYYRAAADWASRLDPLAGVIDLSDVTALEVSPETIRALAKWTPAMPQTERPRVIIAGTDHVFGMMRVFEIEGEHTRPNLHVVRTLKEACAILGVEEFRFEPMAE